MLTFGLIAACYTNLAMTICLRRDSGVLKRMRGTPDLHRLLHGRADRLLLIVWPCSRYWWSAIGMVFYHLHFPYHPCAVLVTLLVGIVTFCALGMAVTILVTNADAAPAVINGIYFPIVFISGVFYPLAQGSVLARIADYFPVRHLILALVSAFEGGPGSGLRVSDLAVMPLWAAGALVFTARRFRWEPSATGDEDARTYRAGRHRRCRPGAGAPVP